jgi:hypothetical protein
MNALTAPAPVEFDEPTGSVAGNDADAPSSPEVPEPTAARSDEPGPITSDGPMQHEIAVEAYTRYLLRGARDGHADEDWFEAERSVRERHAQSFKIS